MSRKNIYIRNENEDKWDSLENKSAWVNDMLTGGGKRLNHLRKELGRVETHVVDMLTDSPKPIKTPKTVTYKKTQNWGA